MSNQPPIEVPQGAIRFNTDSQKLEFFAQDRWYGMATDVPTLDGGVRGVFGGGYQPSEKDVIDFVTISTAGNATDFGNLTEARGSFDASGSRTRGFWFGGENPATDRIDFVTIASTGDAHDFGDITESIGANSAQCGSSTRGIIWGGYPAGTNIDSLIIASQGNTVKFGDSTIDLNYRNCTSDSVRGVSGGGQDGPGAGNTIEYITIASDGDAVDFGDLTTDAHDSGGCFSNGHGGLG